MRYRRRLSALAILVALLVAFFLYDPEPRFHPASFPPVSERARRLHDATLVIDLHVDSLIWPRDLREEGLGGQLDLPRMHRGGLDAAAFTIPTQYFAVAGLKAFHDRLSFATWFSPWARFTHSVEKMEAWRNDSASALRLATEATSLRRNHQQGWLSVFHGIEGAHALGEDLSRLAVAKRMGVVFVAPVHLSGNAYGGSSLGSDLPLTDLGRRLLAEMNREKIFVDLAHASPRTFDEALSLTDLPPIVSHAGARGVHDVWRNLSDEQIRAVAGRGGIIGVMLAPPALSESSLEEAFRHLEYIVAVGGEDCAALGSDFDGFVTPPIDAAGLPLLTERMLAEGWSELRIRKILGENFLRLLEARDAGS